MLDIPLLCHWEVTCSTIGKISDCQPEGLGLIED